MKKSIHLLAGMAFAALLSGCSVLMPDRSLAYEEDDLALFAYDLGSTHAGLARCPGVSAVELDAHLESARIALRGQVGHREAELTPVFEQGLHESAGPGRRLHIDCTCAADLVKESRRHNMQLYRAITLPRAYRQGSSS